MHKKYTYRNGKKYGPYLYKSERVGDKVITHYVGSGDLKDLKNVGEKNLKNNNVREQQNKLFTIGNFNNLKKPMLVLLISVLIVFGLVFAIQNGISPTGKASLLIEKNYKAGELIGGVMKLNLRAGEFIPADSRVSVSLNGQQKEFLLSDLISLTQNEGNFYAENSGISGSGLGYGVFGEKKSYPSVDFELEISKETGNEESAAETPAEQPTEQIVNEPPIDNGNSNVNAPTEGGVVSDNSAVEAVNNEPTSENNPTNEIINNEQNSINENNNPAVNTNDNAGTVDNSAVSEPASVGASEPAPAESSSAGITGAVVSEDKQIVSGSASKGNDFVYSLKNKESASIVSGSVKVNGEEMGDGEISLINSESEARVSTDYAIAEQGYGSGYLGEDYALNLQIDLSRFGINATQGALIITLSYNGNEIVSASDEINVEGAEVKPIEENETIANETIINATEINKTKIKDKDINETEKNKTKIKEKELNETQVNVTIENASIALALIKDIPTTRIAKDASAILDLGEYFAGAERYEMASDVENITEIFDGNILTLTADSGFNGARKGKIIAYAGNDSIESNEFNILVSSGAVNIRTTREKIVVGEKVKWKKEVSLENPENVIVELPSTAENVSVKKVESNGNEEKVSAGITGGVVAEINADNGFSLIRWIKNLLFRIGITGRAVDDSNGQANETGAPVEVSLEENATSYTIEYYTEAPSETIESVDGKDIATISAPSELNYTDVIASADINASSGETIKIYWYNYDFKKENITLKDVDDVENESVVEETGAGAGENVNINNGGEVVNDNSGSEVSGITGSVVEGATADEGIIENSSNNIANETNSNATQINDNSAVVDNEAGVVYENNGSEVVEVNGSSDVGVVVDNGSASEVDSGEASSLDSADVNEPVVVAEENIIAAEAEEENSSRASASELGRNLTEFEKRFGVEGVDYIKQEVPYDSYDMNNDSLADYLEWVVPHLSEQSFEIIIVVTKAEHLDANKTFISDIYESVKALDGNWSEQIPAEDYVRVTFERNLNSTNDITVYARSSGSNGSAGIEVYERDGMIKLADFGGITAEKYYKVILENLTNSRKDFDLKVVNGGVEFDYIVDPTISGSGTYADNLSLNVTKETGFAHLNISTTAPYDKLVGYWSFDVNDTNPNTNKTYDYSQYDNDGTATASSVAGENLSWVSNCNNNGYGGCYFFDSPTGQSANTINVGNPASLVTSVNQTQMIWIYPTKAMDYGDIMGHRARDLIYFSGSGENHIIYYFNGATSWGFGNIIIRNSNWTHIAMVVNASGGYLFVNGTRIQENTAVTIGTGSSNFHIGNDILLTYGFIGYLDEAMVFNASLTPAQISAIYNNQSARFEKKGEMQFWNLKESTATSALISIPKCQNYMDSNLTVKINDGAEVYLVNCEANVTWTDVGEANLTIGFNASANQFYSPAIVGDIVVQEYISTLYWVGDSNGNWSDADNWATTSGGAGGAGVPYVTTNVIFDGSNENNSLIDTNFTGLVGSVNISLGYNGTITSKLDWNSSLNVTNNFDILNGTFTHFANTGTTGNESFRVNLIVGGNLTVDEYGLINVTAKGYPVGNGPGVITCSNSQCGGTHGGNGGSATTAVSSMTTYGSVTSPTNLGTGGKYYLISSGGGAVSINVSGMTRINGTIASDGNTDHTGASGGSVYIVTSNINGTGKLTALGGQGTVYASGGGGRIAVILISGTSFTRMNMSAYGGTALVPGGAGTIYLKKSDDKYGELRIDNLNKDIFFQKLSTALSINTTYNGSSQVYTFDLINLTNCGALEVENLTSVLNLSSMGILTNITGDGKLCSRLVISSFYNLTIPNEDMLNISNFTLSFRGVTQHKLNRSLTLTNKGFLTHESGYASEFNKLNLSIDGNLTVMAGGGINVTGRGYSSGNGQGRAGVCGGSQCGGSYGGIGGNSGASMLATTYGSVAEPGDLGSGAPYYQIAFGGGAVILNITGTTLINGTIDASGNCEEAGGNGGAGGSIYLNSSIINGSGVVRSNGGSGQYGAGGGGRVAVITSGEGVGKLSVVAYGGTPGAAAAAGTVYIKDSGAPYGQLIVDNNALSSVKYTLISENVTAEVGNVNVRNLGRLNVSQGNLASKVTFPSLTIRGDFNRTGTGVFAAGINSTIIFAGDINQNTTFYSNETFYNLNVTKTGGYVFFPELWYTNVTGSFGVLGAAGAANYAFLRSTTSGIRWNLNQSGFNVLYADVKDSNNTGTTIAAVSSATSGNNYGWSGLTNTLYWVGNSSGNWSNPASWASTSGGAPGTIAPDETSNLIFDGSNENDSLIDPAFAGAVLSINISLGYNGTITSKLDWNSSLNVTNNFDIANGTFTHFAHTSAATGNESWRVNLKIGGNLTVDVAGEINVTGKGFAGGQGTGTAISGNYVGGSYGGVGGISTGFGATMVGVTYGSVSSPTNLGSGGSGPSASSGGGAILINVSGNATINGSIIANGGKSAPGYGEGSGGSIYITAQAINGSGIISANGEAVTYSNPGYSMGSGGGGRIALVLTSGINFGKVRARAFGGFSGLGVVENPGASGTVYLKKAEEIYGSLIVDNNQTITYAVLTSDTPTTTFSENTTYNGTSNIYTFDSINLTRCGALEIENYSILNISSLGVWTNITSDRKLCSRLVINNFNNLTLSESDGNFNITNFTLSMRGLNQGTLSKSLVISNNSYLTHEDNINLETSMINFTINGNLTIMSGGVINVTDVGYDKGYGPGVGIAATYIGGSYGGVGGISTGFGATTPGTTYGSITSPINLGSGANGASGASNGGGAVIINISGNATINGSIHANAGKQAAGYTTGSGGSVYLLTQGMSGNGVISTNSETVTYSNSPFFMGSGGGGRIAIVLTSGINFGNVKTYSFGRSSDGSRGGAGTVYLKDGTQTYGTLIIDNNETSTTLNNASATLISQNVTGTIVGDVHIRNGGYLNISANSTSYTAEFPTLTVYGNWNRTSGNFSAGYNSTIIFTGDANFNSTLTNETFWNLNISKTGGYVFFPAMWWTNVSGKFNVWGNATHYAYLRSNLTGTQWNLNQTSYSVLYADVKDSNNSGITIRATNSTNSGNNNGWDFTVVNVTALNWSGSCAGGCTSEYSFLFGEVLDYVNATVTGVPLSVNLSLIAPDGTVMINNVSMFNASTSNNWSNTSDVALKKVGMWNITVYAYSSDMGQTSTLQGFFNITVVNRTLAQGFFGYDTQAVTTNLTIANLASYGYDLFEIHNISSGLEGNWTDIKNAMERAHDLNMKVGLKFRLDYNMTNDTTARNDFLKNISEYFDELLTSPYIDVVDYIKIDVNGTKFPDANITNNNLDLIGANITSITGDEFVVYTNYNSSTLDTDYIQYASDLEYVSGDDEAGLISNLANLTKARTSKTRIYHDLSADQKNVSSIYFVNIIVPLTAGINATSNISEIMVSELGNGDLIVYNNLSTRVNVTYNVSNGSDILGKDIWDYTNQILVDNNSNGTISFLDIAMYSAILAGTESIQRLDMDSLLTRATVFKTAINTVYNSNHTDGNREGGSDASTARAVELWDNSYVSADSLIYYGWLNVTGIANPYRFNGLTYLVIADKNDAEIDKLFWSNVTITGVYGYVSVADYDYTNDTWYAGKKTLVDRWIGYNQSINIFFDGLDAAEVVDTDGSFDIKMKNLTDYVKITCDKEVGINVFTQYQTFAQLSSDDGFAMRESCTHKWVYANGVDNTAGYNYSNQYWEDFGGYGDYNQSRWYNKHNVNLICVAFADRNYSAYRPDSMNVTNYELMNKLFLKSKVLGYPHFILSTPHFNIAYDDKYYNVGTKLQSEPTINDDLYSMKYTNGIAYYNSTSDKAWFEDGRTFSNGSINLTLFDSTAFTYNVSINNFGGYGITTAGDGWSYDWHTLFFNESVWNSSFGHYVVSVKSADGGYTGDDTNSNAVHDRHSFYNNSGYWAAEAETTGNHMINLMTNDTKSTSLGITTKIEQVNNNNSQNITTVNLSSAYHFRKPVRTFTTTGYGVFRKLKIWDGSAWVEATYTNSTACSTANPVFTYQTIAGVGSVGVCIDNSVANTTKAKVEFPTLSERAFKLDMDNVVPAITVLSPENITYDNSTIWFNATADETIDKWRVNYNDTGLNRTLSAINTAFDVLDGSYRLMFYANDSYGNVGTDSSIYFVVDSTAPTVSPSNPGDAVAYTSASQAINYQYTTIDSGTGVNHCNLSVNANSGGYSVVNSSLAGNLNAGVTIDSTGVTVHSFKHTLSAGSYAWKITCYDNANHSTTSTARTFTITAPAAASTGTATTGPSPGGGGGQGGTPSIESKPTMAVYPEGVSASLIMGAGTTQQITLENLLDKTVMVDVSVTGDAKDFIVIEKRIVLEAGEEKDIDVGLTAPEEVVIGGETLLKAEGYASKIPLSAKTSASKDGIITGEILLKTQGYIKRIPVVINIRSENFLFDNSIVVSPDNKVVTRGEKVRAQVNLIQVGPKEKVDVTANYVIKDFAGKVHHEESETFYVLENKEYVKEFDTSSLPSGRYIVGLEIIYPGAFATSSSQFEVSGGASSSSWMIIAAIVGVAILAGIVIKMRKGFERRKKKIMGHSHLRVGARRK